jgi:hypothetical protein
MLIVLKKSGVRFDNEHCGEDAGVGPMNDAFVMRGGQRIRDLPADVQRFGYGKRPGSIEPGGERFPVRPAPGRDRSCRRIPRDHERCRCWGE